LRPVVSRRAETTKRSGSNDRAGAVVLPETVIPLLRKSFAHPAHDSLQMPVKYEGSDFQTHRQIRGLV